MDDPRRQLRRHVYLLLIVLSTGAMLGRILAVDAVDQAAVEDYRFKRELATKVKKLRGMELEPRRYQQALERERKRLLELLPPLRRPFLSANDRSRWCTVRALVDPDMRVEGAPYAIDKVIQEPAWDTIDMVKHDGHLYSSKPPLLPTLLAGEYWLVHRLTGVTLGTDPDWVGRVMLITVNVIPLVVYLLLLARLAERFGATDWGRLFVVATAAFGTFLTTFAVTLNNHLPAAVSALIALYAAVRIWFDGERRLRYFVVAGLFGAFTAANELPATSLFVALSAAILWKAPVRTILAYFPAALVVATGFFGTNWIAHHSLRPPYMHRRQIVRNPPDKPDREALTAAQPGPLQESGREDNWYDYTYEIRGKTVDSYWRNPQGIDRGEPSRTVYVLHVLIGHHGIFSLTPVWLMAAAGLVMWSWKGPDRRLRGLALLIGAVSLVCLVFLLMRPVRDCNYGGMTSGFRWMFWLAPLWLLAVFPAADAMARRRPTRFFALVLLAVSVLSASYPVWNPWTHPWIMDYLSYLGWL